MKSDIEIAQACPMRHIREIAREVGVEERYLEQYGNYKAKIDDKLLQEKKGPDGKLILVTAITPTPAGEGKTTTTVGLADGPRGCLGRMDLTLPWPRKSWPCSAWPPP